MPEKQKEEERKRKREARSFLEGGKGENKNWVGNRDHCRRESGCESVKGGGYQGVRARGERDAWKGQGKERRQR